MKDKMIKACIFDLDGTIADTLESMAYVANEIMEKFSLKPQPADNFRYYSGEGADMLIRRCLIDAGDPELVHYEEVRELYRRKFDEDPLYKVVPYKDMPETLQKLKHTGLKMAVCSNKPHVAAQKVVKAIYGDLFDEVMGQQEGIRRKPAPDGPLKIAEDFLREKFAKKPEIAEANIKVIHAGYDYGHNTHASVAHTYKIESKIKTPGIYMDIMGNKATAYGFIAAAEKAGLKLFLGSYPITPATDVLHELSKHKSLGVITLQCEDEISGCATAIGASFAGALAVTTTSGPGVCLKSEAMNLAVITELPLVVLDVQRGGPSTGLPTKSEQTDMLQALFGRNRESPIQVIAATSPTNCFDAAYAACKMALEHMTPVVLLTDGFVANGSGSWKLPNLDTYPEIKPQYVTPEMKDNYTPYKRNPENQVRYWAVPGQEGYTHILGGLEKDSNTGAISTDPENHNLMCHLRAEKVAKIAVPDVEVQGCADDADLLIVGFGGTYGHLYSAMEEMNKAGQKVALAHFSYINPLPKNTAEVLKKYKKVVVAEQNLGQFAGYLRMKVDNFTPYQFNEVKGQPFVVSELVAAFTEILNK